MFAKIKKWDCFKK